MKLAWICYPYFEEDEALPVPDIMFYEPEKYLYKIIIPIVYAEIIRHG